MQQAAWEGSPLERISTTGANENRPRASRLRSIVTTFRTSMVLGVLIIGPMAATVGSPSTHERLRQWAASSWDSLVHGELWRLFTSTFVQSGHGFVGGIVALLAFVPLAEWRIGSSLTAAVFLLGDWISSSLVLAGARVSAVFGVAPARHVLGHLDSGASAACYACAAAFGWSLRGRWRVVVTLGLVLDLVIEAVVTHMLAEIQHTVAVLVGVTLVQGTGVRREGAGA